MKDKAHSQDQQDIDLFRQEMGDVQYIKQDTVLHTKQITTPVRREQQTDKTPNNLLSMDYESDIVGNEETLSFRRSGIQKRLLARLRNGQLKMEAQLDLHGMTIPVAHQAFSEFIDECQQLNIRHVRIIHGKGWGSKHHKPVLKTKLNTWLRENQDVLAFCSARIEDGGAGAVYVLLRRLK
jgi:DNA-nicking Smr family endonuclease